MDTIFYTNSISKMLLSSNHLLIAGATGSGKSVVLRSLLREIMATKHPSAAKVILLDPKRVDFAEYNYNNEPHILRYANDYNSMVSALNYAVSLMEQRYVYMEKNHLKTFNGADVYVIIDEYADLHDIGGKAVESKIIRLCQLARAAKIHVIIATQRAVGCISTRIRTNIDCRLALHTVTAKESANIIDIAGAEKLPRNGYGLLCSPDGYVKLKLDYCDESETNKLIDFWCEWAKEKKAV